MNPIFLSIVVPAFNEEACIGATIDRLAHHLDTTAWTWEIVVSNDGSSDATAQIVSDRSAVDPRVRLVDAAHMGKGAAVRRGMIEARGQWRFLCDADLSMAPAEIDRFFRGPGGMPAFDVSAGSREAHGARRLEEPWTRHLTGRAFTWAVKLLLMRGIEDTQCGFKLFSADAAEVLFPHQRLKGWGFDAEVLFLARRAGFTVGEIPITWQHFTGSKVSLLGGANGFLDILRVRLNQALGRYRGIRRNTGQTPE